MASTKKESLRKAFEDLQSHSAALASFTLQWKDLESHLDSIEKSIETRFKETELKENEKEQSKVSTLPEKEKTPAKKRVKKSPEKTNEFMEATPRPEIKSLCEKMDGKGLRSFMNKNRKELAEIRNEIVGALRFASDPAKMVLDAMGGFYSSVLNSKGDKDVELAAN
ncbi:truncated FRIGIDA-like protein 1 [Tasmannia lanceolata]|uniref:truncated FRIGIDA-like protein 1 n=1 Tax=Tasmannia lanceolata TaxID=3420 RepID=UPI004063BF85